MGPIRCTKEQHGANRSGEVSPFEICYGKAYQNRGYSMTILDFERVLDNWKYSSMVFSVAEASNLGCVGNAGSRVAQAVSVKQPKVIDIDFSVASVVVNIRRAGKWMFTSNSYRKT